MQTRVPRMLADNSGRITGYPQGMQVADKPTTRPSGMRFVDERVGDDALTENRIFSKFRTP